jgi:hypothetical protein
MSALSPIKIPPRLLVLDAIGTLLLALGIGEQFAGLRVWPEPLQFPGDGIAIMGTGALMMAPLFMHLFSSVVRQLEVQRRENRDRR